MIHTEARRRAAYHEVAHAVGLIAQGYGVVDVQIRDDGSGHTRRDKTLVHDDWGPTKEAAVALLGALAEQRWFGDSGGHGHDEGILRSLAGKPGFSLPRAEQLAADILGDHAAGIQRAVKVVLDQGAITGQQIQDIVFNPSQEIDMDNVGDIANMTLDGLRNTVAQVTGRSTEDLLAEMADKKNRLAAVVDEQVSSIRNCEYLLRKARRDTRSMFGHYCAGLASYDEVRAAIDDEERHETWLHDNVLSEVAEQILNDPRMPAKFDLAKAMRARAVPSRSR